jgi:hypothetical protein
MLRRRVGVAAAAAVVLAGAAATLAHCSRTALTDLDTSPVSQPTERLAFPAYHFDAARTGWSDHESVLVPSAVARGLRRAWTTDAFDVATVRCANDDAGVTTYPARLFASPLYVDDVALSAKGFAGTRGPLAVAATTSGWVYAVAADDSVAPGGTVLWRRLLGTPICVTAMDRGTPLGVLATPVIDMAA